MSNKLNFHCGFVSLIGEPNAGKSTLFNTLISNKTAIVTNKPQTTRDQILGILTTEEMQVIFIDTPGIHKQKNYLDKILNRQAVAATKTSDLICLLVPANKRIDTNHQHIIKILQEREIPIILLLSKTDLVNKEQLFLKINEWKDLMNFKEIIPISSLKQINIDLLKRKFFDYLPVSEKLYEDNNNLVEEKNILKEIIREKIILLTRQEIPYSVAIKIENFENNKKLLVIDATIIVEKKSQKTIIVGKNGEMIKTIGINSRAEIEKIYNKKVLLKLFVKLIEDWRNNPKKLNELGYK